jgi:ubiquinone/menaquinone biosynthesis C-methylase UbiE
MPGNPWGFSIRRSLSWNEVRGGALMKNGSYQFENLENRHVESAFLAERAQLRLDGFKDLLGRHGFPSTGQVLEVGAGHGIRSQIMAREFPQARILALDRSPEILNEARIRCGSSPNLSFHEGDLYEAPFEKNSFDFIYARLVFMHLTDPLKALEALKGKLRSGGKILIEDADRDCMFFEPAPASFPDFWSRVQEGQKRLGGDPNVGRKLETYLKKTGFQQVKSEVQPILGNGADIEFLARTLMPSLNLYLRPSERSLGEKAIHDLKLLSQDPNAAFYHFWFVVSGEKP